MDALIVDDHALIRDALKGLLGGFPEIGGVLEAVTAAQAKRALADHPSVGLVLLDLTLPDGDGLSLLQTMRSTYPAVSVVVLSASEDREDMKQALGAGASGFIPKTVSRDVMVGALNLVFSGGVYVPAEVLGPSVRPRGARPRSADLSALSSLGLTGRQVAVLQLMMQGKSNKAICRDLDIAEATVKNHVTAILRALGVGNRTEAVVAATVLIAEAEH